MPVNAMSWDPMMASSPRAVMRNLLHGSWQFGRQNDVRPSTHRGKGPGRIRA